MRNDSGNAALYLRSSKDRNDVSPAAQRHALEAIATSRSLSIVATFEDAAISSSDPRPQFDQLVQAIRNPHRGWSHILVYDTSRIVRGRYFAVVFKHELKKRGIRLHYATRPENIDPISEIVLDAMMEAWDEVHSLLSKQKGLAGMAENVRQGYRAGGRAPYGYALRHIPTGAIREGKPVTKSRLEPSEISHQVRDYLRARAKGVPRVVAHRDAMLEISTTSLIGVEWNALTYAGHTVWNIHREPGTGPRRRPREEWQITRDTHPPLISEREAESILAALETSNVAASLRAARMATSEYPLSGLLFTTDGRMWIGDGQHYRLRGGRGMPGRIVQAAMIEEGVTATLKAFLASEDFSSWLHEAAQRARPMEAMTQGIRAKIRKLERQRQRAALSAVAGESAEVWRELVDSHTRQIAALTREADAIEREASTSCALHVMSAADIRTLLADAEPAVMVRNLVDRVMLTTTLDCQIRIRDTAYNAIGPCLASPGGFGSQSQAPILPVALAKRA